TMRREGYELGVSRPEVILKEIDGKLQEPFEELMLDIEEQHQGTVMERLGLRRGQLTNMIPDGKGRIRLDYQIPTRGLIGFHNDFLTMTSGSGIMTHVFDHYGDIQEATIITRQNGVLIANATGAAVGFALWNLQERGKLIIGPQTNTYEGMIIGIHSRNNDLVVNVQKAKQLTNVRASGTDENIQLTPPIRFTLEQA
ncbi:translational GTPase TypA, partial [Bacillus halotolerans]